MSASGRKVYTVIVVPETGEEIDVYENTEVGGFDFVQDYGVAYVTSSVLTDASALRAMAEFLENNSS
jgi:hypothetical protein